MAKNVDVIPVGDINDLKKLNNKAKDLVKVGEFRLLSRNLKKIFDSEIGRKFLNKNFSTDGKIFDNEDIKFGLEYEILRFRLFAFQHLSYFDALLNPKSDLRFRPEDHDLNIGPVELPELFANLNYLRDEKNGIVSIRQVKEEAELEYLKISNDTQSSDQWKSKSFNEKKLWQERVWLILCHVNEIYHLDKLDEAMAILETLEKFVFTKLADDYSAGEVVEERGRRFYCFTTKATILALIANCHNMKGNLHKAEVNYYEAIEFYTQKANNPKDEKDTSAAVEESSISQTKLKNIKFQFRRTAQIFIYGMLKINSKNSNIDRCKANILIAELLLTDQREDETTFLVVEFSKSVIKRVLSGSNEEKLFEVRERLLTIKAELEILEHRTLLAEVNFELAIIHHLLKEWNEAEYLLQQVEEFYDQNIYRIKTNIAILRSHMERGRLQYADSLKLGVLALEYAEFSNNPTTIIDASICLAESAFMLEKGGIYNEEYDALFYFERASSLNAGIKSPKIEAICSLGLCKVLAFRREEKKAKEYWRKYQNIKQFCQHKFIFDVLEEQVLKELSPLNLSFVIDTNETDLKYEKHAERLRSWLYSKARENSNTDDEVAKKLDISRQSVIAWRSKFGVNKRRK